MRRMLILLAVVAAGAAALTASWIFGGREISLLIDRYWTIEVQSVPIQAITYEGIGTGGNLICNGVSFSLNDVPPALSLTIDSAKDDQFALASNGKVFSFGPVRSASDDTGERLSTGPSPGDQTFVTTRHSVLSWPTPFEVNLMSGHSPSWKRHMYYEIRWRKTSGANLLMLWRYEQFFYPGNGWASGFMTREGSTGLVRVRIEE